MNNIIVTDLEMHNVPLGALTYYSSSTTKSEFVELKLAESFSIKAEELAFGYNIRLRPALYLRQIGYTRIRDLQRGGFVIIPDKEILKKELKLSE